jgi:L-amino acid N-acyltransferase YncA
MILCESWKAAYQGIIPPEEMALRTDVEKRTIRFRAILENGAGTNFIASYGGKPCGVLAFGKGRDADLPGAAEVFSIHALDTVWGKGVGHAMLTFALAELERQGYHEVLLWVFEANDRARKCYERHGFAADGTAKDSGLGHAIEIRYRKTLDKRRNPA